MNLEVDVRTSQKTEEFTRKTKSTRQDMVTCAMSGCMNKVIGRFIMQQQRLLAQIIEQPEDVGA